MLGISGQIRRNKWLEQLTEAFSQNSDPRQRLLIAGLPRDAILAETLRARAAQDAGIRLEFHDLSHAQFREAINCCDVVVAPLQDYQHSGSLVHSFTQFARGAHS